MTDLGSASVCMATYNGAKHVKEQIASILDQLGEGDELIVVDDRSLDDTVARLRSIGDPRLRLVEGEENRGYARRFEEAMGMARGQHIFLADQDDVWPAGRLTSMQHALEFRRVVAGNVDRLDGGSLRPPGTFGTWRLTRAQQKRRFSMVVKLAASQAPYYGSAMGIRRDVLPVALPFPSSARELHDAWLALIGLMSGSMGHVEEVVVHHRVHGENTSGRLRPWRRIAVGRLLFLRMLVTAYRRTHPSRRRPVQRPVVHP